MLRLLLSALLCRRCCHSLVNPVYAQPQLGNVAVGLVQQLQPIPAAAAAACNVLQGERDVLKG
jgi:hypothetical protein